MQNKMLCLGVLVVLVASGCASRSVHDEPYGALNADVRSKVRSTKIMIGLDPLTHQQSGPIMAPAVNVQGFGLVGALAGTVTTVVMASVQESSRQKRERQLAAIQDTAINFNFGSQFRSEMEPAIRKVSWMGVTTVTREPNTLRFAAESLATKMDEDALLVVDTSYSLAPDFSKYIFTLHAQLRPKNRQVVGQASEDGVLFRRKYVVHYPLERPHTDEEQAIAQWAENDGAMVNRALLSGISQIVRKVTADMSGAHGNPVDRTSSIPHP